jgi:hypothetical protein
MKFSVVTSTLLKVVAILVLVGSLSYYESTLESQETEETEEAEKDRRYLNDYADPSDYSHVLPDGGFYSTAGY